MSESESPRNSRDPQNSSHTNRFRRHEQVELGALQAMHAYGSGVRTSLRHNATAFGFSISMTAAYGIVSVARSGSSSVLQTVLFAVGAAVAFLLVETLASRMFKRTARDESVEVVMVAGAVDVLSIVAAIGVATACAQLPGRVAWVATSFGTTLAYLLLGGVNILIAHRMARRAAAD